MYDDRGLFDLIPDPYDHEDGFSPSSFHPDMPHESREGSEGEPEPEKPSGSLTGGGPSGGTNQHGVGVEGRAASSAQAPSNRGVSISGNDRISAFTRLTPASATTPQSPSRGSVDSSGRRFHARHDSDSSGRNLSDKDTSSGEHTIRGASLATSSDMRELISLSRDEEPDTQAEERGEPVAPGASINDLLRLRDLQHPAPMPDRLGVDTPADLRFIYAEDLMEDGITFTEAIKLLQGYQSSGAVRPFISSPGIIRALPVRVHC